MRLIPVVAVCLTVLSACSSIPSTVPTVPRPKPSEAMAETPAFPKPESPKAQDLARALQGGAEAYGACQADKKALIEWINRGK